MTEDRIERNFAERSSEEQALLLKHTWCDHCQEQDIGMVEPEEYELGGCLFLEGRCLRCASPVYTELTDDDF